MPATAAFGDKQLDGALTAILGLDARVSAASSARLSPALRQLRFSRKGSVAMAASLGFALLGGVAALHGDQIARWIGERNVEEARRVIRPVPSQIARIDNAPGPTGLAMQPSPAVLARPAELAAPPGAPRADTAPAAARRVGQRGEATNSYKPANIDVATSEQPHARSAEAGAPALETPARLASLDADAAPAELAPVELASAAEPPSSAGSVSRIDSPARQAHARRESVDASRESVDARRESVDAMRALRWQW